MSTIAHQKKLFVFICASGVISAFLLISFLAYGRTEYTASSTVLMKSIEHSPARLIIPKIHVDAVIGRVGLTKEGAVDAPTDPKNAAWFTLGPRPGEKGSAVIDGHFGWKNNIPAVFDNLSRLRAGDTLSVVDTDGTKSDFVVVAVRSYGTNDNASAVFMASDDNAHLNLITCEGVWNKKQKSYSGRLVVFTDKIVSGAPK